MGNKDAAPEKKHGGVKSGEMVNLYGLRKSIRGGRGSEREMGQN